MTSITRRDLKCWRSLPIISASRSRARNEEIKGFCSTKYSVTFPLFSKISVKGGDKHPLYQYLTEQSPFPGEVEWNFPEVPGGPVRQDRGTLSSSHEATRALRVVKEVERVLAEHADSGSS